MTIIAPTLSYNALAWVANNYDKLPAIAGKAADILQGVLQQGSQAANTIQRLGSNIVWNSPSGKRVIGVLDEVQTSLNGIEAQQAITHASIESLRNVSMVTLGFSGVTVGLLAAQFAYLGKRLSAIQHELKKIQLKIDATQEAQLKAALGYIQQAESASGERRSFYFGEAFSRARDVCYFFSSQAIDPAIHNNDPRIIQFYARKYFLALSVEIAGLLGRDEVADMVNRIKFEDSTLRRVSSLVYDVTLKDRLDELLSPELTSIAPLPLIEQLYTQAADLGCITCEAGFDIRILIDQERKAIYSHGGMRDLPFSDFRSFKQSAAENLAITAGIFEEVQRLMSWSILGTSLVDAGIVATELQDEVRKAKERLANSEGDVMIYGIG